MSTRHGLAILALSATLTACGQNGSVATSEKITKANVGAAATTAVATNAALSMTDGAVKSKLSDIPSGKYKLDPGHGYINFSYSHLGFSNPSIGFRTFTVDLNLDAQNISKSTLQVDIDVNSIDSRVKKFDDHLVGADMFDTAKFPRATFTSTGIDVLPNDMLSIAGDLTIKDVTKSVILDTKINKASNHPMGKVPTIGVSATTRIKRSDFGVSYALPHVGDEVDISIEVELPQVVDK